jgi:hypothetical protein
MASLPPKAEWAEEHKRFEEWARPLMSLSTNWDGTEYDYPTTKFAWWGWKARAADGVEGHRG